MSIPDSKDYLRARLRAADPARNLAPLEPIERRGVVLAATRLSSAGSRRWRMSWALVGGAVTTGVGALVVVNVLSPSAALSTLDYGAAGAPASACSPVTAEALAKRESAFEAVVTAITAQEATLRVEHVYTGDVTEQVTVPQSSGQASEIDLGVLEVGQTYLIAIDDTTVATCGQSGPESPDLRELYQEAFS